MELKIFYNSINILIIIFFVPTIETRGTNGGISCAACTIVVGLMEQLSEIHNTTIINQTKELCDNLPNYLREPCLIFADDIEPIFLNRKFYKFLTPDVICYVIGSCVKDEKHGYCHLFPRPYKNFRKTILTTKKLMRKSLRRNIRIDVCKLPIIKDICDVFTDSLLSLNPLQDTDDDGFSVINTARGYNWRGKDCRDWDPNVYPGRLPIDNDIDYDSNCNGIWGINEITGKSWEETLCNGTSKGIIYIGDSIGAHFHFPEIWMNPIKFSFSSIQNVTNDVLDELDWPQLGFTTGFTNTTQPDLISGDTDSIYLKMRNRNRCNHRDYQNLSQNGAASFDIINHISAVARNQSSDHPAIVFYAFLGNDVCNRFQDTIHNMTPPAEFQQNVLTVLNVLEEKLPSNSHVILVGLIDGSFIYPTMANRIHPLGSLNKNIRYKDVYKWFNCMEIGPCAGWMTPNETLRNITTQKAQELTEVLKSIVKNYKFPHFTLHFLDNPIQKIIKTTKYPWDLIDPIDSLHPNQKSQRLLAKVFWEQLLSDLPNDVLGPVNVNNEMIEQIFGNQGGH